MTDERELRKLARGGIGGLLGSVITGLGGLVFITIAARGFAKVDVGIVFTLTSLFLIALAIVTLGSDVGLVRFVAVRLVDDSRDAVASVVVSTLVPVLVLSTGAATGLWFLLPLWETHSAIIEPARLFALFLPFAAVSNLVLAGTRGLGSIRPTIVVESLLRQGLQPLLALLVALRTNDVNWLAMAWVSPYAVSCVAAIISFRRLCRQHDLASWVSPRSPEVRGVWREVWTFNGPRAVTQIAQIGIRRADIPIVAALAGASAAAVYTAASRFVAAGLQGIKGIQQMVGPQIARLYAAGRVDQAGLTLRTATTWNVLIAWPVYLTCAVIPSVVLLIFGKGYSSGTPVVIILALGMLAGIAAGPVDIALLMLGRSVQSLRNNMAALLTNLALNLTLVPVLGISGAALAWSASILVSNLLPSWQIRLILGNAFSRATALAGGLAVVSFACPPLLARLVGLDAPLEQVASSFVGGLGYLVLVYRARRTLRVGELVAVVRRRRSRQQITADPAQG